MRSCDGTAAAVAAPSAAAADTPQTATKRCFACLASKSAEHYSKSQWAMNLAKPARLRKLLASAFSARRNGLRIGQSAGEKKLAAGAIPRVNAIAISKFNQVSAREQQLIDCSPIPCDRTLHTKKERSAQYMWCGLHERQREMCVWVVARSEIVTAVPRVRYIERESLVLLSVIHTAPPWNSIEMQTSSPARACGSSVGPLPATGVKPTLPTPAQTTLPRCE